jgi:hypothetical protein
MTYLFLGLILWMALLYWHQRYPQRGHKRPTCSTAITHPMHSRAKPAWVKAELLQLAARDPQTSCRSLTDIFNRRHANNGMSVGKSFVSGLMRKQQYEVMRLHRNLRQRHYLPGRCLSLRALKNKASITLLHALLDAVEQYGVPKAIRTDNEAVFQSRLFRLGLAVLSIGHQSIVRGRTGALNGSLARSKAS